MNNGVVLSELSGIKADQIPNSAAEAKFKNAAAKNGYTVHRPSWPDFILEKDGKLLFVEVKGANDEVSKFQRQTFNLLVEHGFPIFLWKDSKETRSKLAKWTKYTKSK